jgi:hypothetical protein
MKFQLLVVLAGLCLPIFFAHAQTGAPVVATLTSSQTVAEGQNVSLAVSVNGTPPFSYQWKKEGNNIAGATTGSFGLSPIRVPDAGSYTVSVTNAVGSTTSGPVLIAVTPASPPSLSSPSNRSVTVGSRLDLSVSASGTFPMIFEWRRDGATIASTTNSSYTIPAAQFSDAGSYTVMATNLVGSATSVAFTVTITPPAPPTISSQPSDRMVEPGNFLGIGVGVNGTTPMTFQWFKDGVLIPNATNNSYSKSGAQATDAGSYTVTITNAVGTVMSNAARVTMLPATGPTIWWISSNAVVAAGSSFRFSVDHSGSSPFTYQWFKEGQSIPGATNSSYGVNAAQAVHVGAYSVAVTNSQGTGMSESRSASVLLPQPPAITQHPISMVVASGSSSSLSVGVTGTSPFTYQWRKDGSIIPNAVSSSYSLPSNLASSDAGSFTVVVSNSLGSVVSEPANVTVLPAAAPTINTHPSGQSVVLGGSFVFAANMNVPNDTTFQWRKDGTAIASATNSAFSKTTAVAGDAGVYSLMVTNALGSVSTNGATLTVVAESAPVILRHPSSVALLPGESMSLTVFARSASTIGYQWRRDGAAIVGATRSNFSSGNAQPTLAGSYDVVLTNVAGSSTSRVAVVTVDALSALITGTTGGMAVSPGGNLSLNVTTSARNLVQWRKDGVVIPNATNTNFSISQVTINDFGTYAAEVRAANNTTATSIPIVVEHLDRGVAPRIVRQPASQDRSVGGNSEFSVIAEGERPLTYQWRKDGVVIPAATNSSYSVGSLAAGSAGVYTVVVTNASGSATSEAAILKVTNPAASLAPVIRAHPNSMALVPGGNSASLNVSMVVSTGVTYQWRKDDVPIPGANLSSFTISSSPISNGTAFGRYSVVVSNAVGSVTSFDANVSILDLVSPPTIASQPQAIQSVLPGSTVVFAATVNGTAPISYEWRKGGVPIPGATASTFVINDVPLEEGGLFTLIATNAAGITSTTAARLSVQFPPVGPPIATAQPRSITVIPSGSTVLFAGFSANPPATYQWRKDGVAIPGATQTSLNLTNVSAASAGRYALVATNVHGSTTTSEAVVSLGAAITFAALPRDQSAAAGTAFVLAPNAQSSAALTYQWRKNGVAIAGATNATLAFAALVPGDSGSYTLVATNRDGSIESAPVALNITSSPHTGIYFGTFAGSGSWALVVAPEGLGTFIGLRADRNQAVVMNDFLVFPDGRFAAVANASFGAGFFNGGLSGTISGGTAVGQLVGENITLSGTIKPVAGATSAVAGYYRAVALASAVGETHLIAAADGTIQLVAFDASGARGGRGSVGPTGAFTLVQPQFVYSGNVGANAFAGTYQLAGGPVVALAAPAAVNGPERLANVSTRGIAGSGARTLIAGFVISGNAPKDMLVRGAGPALAAFGVTGVLPNPRLRIFSGAASLFENDDWNVGGFVSQITAASTRVGAFPFPPGGGDSALLVRLNPGSYTAQVTSDAEATGVALVEVYDASATSADPQKVINLSTRGDVGTGTNILIVGVVVSGNAPKKVLVRGVGPTLASFGVTGALADPQLQLYRGPQLIRENDNWSSGADAALVTAAAQAVGAFVLPNGSRDAALLLYLAPGSYTAQISGTGGTTGVGLLEVYEVP